MVEPLLGGIIGCILLVTLLFLGSPVCIGLGLSGMVGLFLIEGASGAFVGISRMAIENLWSVSLLAVPFFIFMGNMPMVQYISIIRNQREHISGI